MNTKYRLLTLIALLASPLAPTPAIADTLYVWTNSPSPASPYASWDSASLTIQDAITSANTTGDTIILRDGIYRGVGNKNVDWLGKSLCLKSENGSTSCIVDCQSNGQAMVLVDIPGTSTIEGVTFRNALWTDGAAIYCRNVSNLALIGCTFVSNYAAQSGSCLYLSNSAVAIYDSLFYTNRAQGTSGSQYGGTIYAANSPLTVYSTDFIDEISPNGSTIKIPVLPYRVDLNSTRFVNCVGVVEIGPQSSSPNIRSALTMTDCRIERDRDLNNAINLGSGTAIIVRTHFIYNNSVSFDSPGHPGLLLFSNCIFASNAKTALRLLNTSSNVYLYSCEFLSHPTTPVILINGMSGLNMLFQDCRFVSNSNNASSTAGAVDLQGNSSPSQNIVFRRTHFVGNTSTGSGTSPGGSYCNTPGRHEFDTCLFVHNTARSSALDASGALGIGHLSTQLIVSSTTFADNTSTTHGAAMGITGADTGTINNTIMWGNSSTGSPVYVGSTAFPSQLSVTYSAVEGGPTSAYVDVACIYNWHATSVSSNPLFASVMQGTVDSIVGSDTNAYTTVLLDADVPWSNIVSLAGQYLRLPSTGGSYFEVISSSMSTLVLRGVVSGSLSSGTTYSIVRHNLSATSPCVDMASNGPPRDIVGTSRPLDGNNNGISAWDTGCYEYLHPYVDSDHDSVLDLDEGTAGTDATNSGSYLRIESFLIHDNLIDVSWTGVNERRYDIQTTSQSLNDNSWSTSVHDIQGIGTITSPSVPVDNWSAIRLQVRQ